MIFPLVALLLTSAQLVVLFSFSHPSSSADFVARLTPFDSVFYERIVRSGYFSLLARSKPLPQEQMDWNRDYSNGSFMPGYPLLARSVRWLTGVDSRLALVLAANLAAFGFWWMFLLYLDDLGITTGFRVAAVAAVATYPSAFFLALGYSESLFCYALVGLLLWLRRQSRIGSTLACAHGFFLSLTRILGLLLAIVPVVSALAEKKDKPASLARIAAIAASTASGTLLYFAYCQWAFGHWDLYFIVEKYGWHNAADYLFVLHYPRAVFLPWLFELPTQMNFHNKLGLSIDVWIVMLVPFAEAAFGRERRLRVALWVAAALLLYFSAAGSAAQDFRAMIRYLLPVQVLLVAAGAHFVSTAKPLSRVQRCVGWAGFAGIVFLSAWCQFQLIERFVQGVFVA